MRCNSRCPFRSRSWIWPPSSSSEPCAKRPRMAKSVDDRSRGARLARRDEDAYCGYVTEEQRSQPGCIGRECDRLAIRRPLARGGEQLFTRDGIARNERSAQPLHVLERRRNVARGIGLGE